MYSARDWAMFIGCSVVLGFIALAIFVTEYAFLPLVLVHVVAAAGPIPSIAALIGLLIVSTTLGTLTIMREVNDRFLSNPYILVYLAKDTILQLKSLSVASYSLSILSMFLLTVGTLIFVYAPLNPCAVTLSISVVAGSLSICIYSFAFQYYRFRAYRRIKRAIRELRDRERAAEK